MKLLAIAWKDALLRFSEKIELLFFIILPVTFTFLLAGGAARGSTVTTLPLLVVDEDHTPLSAALVAALKAQDKLALSERTAAQAEQAFTRRDAPAWLTIPAGFEAAAISGGQSELDLRKAPNDSQADGAERAVYAAAGALNRAVSAARTSLVEAERLRPFASDAEREAYFRDRLAATQASLASAPLRVTYSEAIPSSAGGYDAASQSSAGQVITWVFIPLLGASSLFAFERLNRTLARLLTTATRPATFLLGSVLGQFLTALVQMTLLMGVSWVLLRVNWGRSPAGVALVMVSFGLASVALGTLLGAFVKTERQASNLSIMLGMVLALLGGCWWPAELFPPVMRTVAQALPTYWAMQGFTNLTMRGLGLQSVLLPAAVLGGMAVVFFSIGVWRFKFE